MNSFLRSSEDVDDGLPHDGRLEVTAMGFRFRKSIKILSGVRLNLSKSGVSSSVGVPGATVNVGQRGVRGTVGLQGTGLSYTERIAGNDGQEPASGAHWIGGLLFAIAVALTFLLLVVER